MRLTVGLIAVVWLAACGPRGRAEPQFDGDVRITVEAHEAAPWRITYELKKPRAELDLGSSIEGYRAAHWRIEGATLVTRDGRDFIEPTSGKLAKFAATIQPAASDLAKEYEPFTAVGEGGVLLYTGHIIPWRSASERLDARLILIAEHGAAISAFGETRNRFDDWQSPFGHPAFVYIGSERPVETEALLTLTDERAPDWIKNEISGFAPAIAAALGKILRRALPTKPNIFVIMGDQSAAGRLNYRGDALPGQYQMTLIGGGWKDASPEALAVLRRSTAHEAAHLWQAAARAKSPSVPDWIHEGGADALAAQAMVAAGFWTERERLSDFETARAKCTASLDGLSLQRAEAEKRWRAVYSCGHVLTVAAAGNEGAGAFWREFAGRAAKEGYDEALFLALAEERVGADAADAMRHLIRINEARPERTIDRMLSARP